jgi:hypothetical protein
VKEKISQARLGLARWAGAQPAKHAYQQAGHGVVERGPACKTPQLMKFSHQSNGPQSTPVQCCVNRATCVCSCSNMQPHAVRNTKLVLCAILRPHHVTINNSSTNSSTSTATAAAVRPIASSGCSGACDCHGVYARNRSKGGWGPRNQIQTQINALFVPSHDAQKEHAQHCYSHSVTCYR